MCTYKFPGHQTHNCGHTHGFPGTRLHSCVHPNTGSPADIRLYHVHTHGFLGHQASHMGRGRDASLLLLLLMWGGPWGRGAMAGAGAGARACSPGQGSPGHLPLLVPSRTQPPLLHAAPEESEGHRIAYREEEAELGPQGGLPGAWPTPDQLERPPPQIGVAVAVRGQRWKTGQPQRKPKGAGGEEREAIKDRDICSLSCSKYRVE